MRVVLSHTEVGRGRVTGAFGGGAVVLGRPRRSRWRSTRRASRELACAGSSSSSTTVMRHRCRRRFRPRRLLGGCSSTSIARAAKYNSGWLSPVASLDRERRYVRRKHAATEVVSARPARGIVGVVRGSHRHLRGGGAPRSP